MDDKLKQQIFLEIAMPICTREKVMLMHKFVQHGKTSCLEHSIAVAYNSFLMAEAMGTEYDRESLIRGGLLHDYFLYDWHEKDGGHRLHGFRHPAFALYNASKDFSLNRKERNIIARHMFPLTVLPPRCLEAWIVCFVDKYCAFSETMGDGRIQWER